MQGLELDSEQLGGETDHRALWYQLLLWGAQRWCLAGLQVREGFLEEEASQLQPRGRRKDKVEGKESEKEGPILRSERRWWLKGEKERCSFIAGYAKKDWRLI